MPSRRYLAVAVTAVLGCIASPTGVALAHGRPAPRVERPSPITRAGSQRPTRHTERIEIAAARLAIRSPALAAQRLLPLELGAIGAAPSIGSAVELDSTCDEGDTNGGGSRGGGVHPSAQPSTGGKSISLNRSVLDELIPAGDLDGVAGTDVLDFRLGSKHKALSAGVTARSGATGAPLWSRTMAGCQNSFSIPFVEPDLVGATAAPGAMLIQESEPFFGSGALPVSLDVQAVDGAGTTQWSQTFSGTVTNKGLKETLTDVPVVAGDLATTNGGHDLLVDVISGVSKPNGSDHGTTQAEVISAADGSVTPIGDPVSASAGVPHVVPVPDLNGDGNADLAVINPDGTIAAEDGLTGASIWTTTDLHASEDAALTPVGDLAKTGAQDLALINAPEEQGGFQGRPDPTTISLIDGATGAVDWTHQGACAYEIDTAGPTHAAAVGVLSHVGSTVGKKTNTTHLTVAPRTLQGKVVYQHTLKVTATAPAYFHHFSFDIAEGPVGDIQPDGSQDFGVRLRASAGKVQKKVAGVISGRNGRFITEPLGGTTEVGLDGTPGDDLVKASSGKHGVTITGYDAATGHRFYRRKVAGTSGLSAGLGYGIEVSGHQCSDVVVGAQGSQGEQIGLYDGNGDPLWTVNARSHQLVSGTVLVALAPSTYCAS